MAKKKDTGIDYTQLQLRPYPEEFKNDATYIYYFNMLKSIALVSFEWDLPPTCDPRYLELCLFNFGVALLFKHNINGQIFNSQALLENDLNIYGIPNKREAISPIGSIQMCDETNSVLIFNDMLHTPTYFAVDMFARRIAKIQRAIDVNVAAQKTPRLFRGTELQKASLEALRDKIERNENNILIDKELDPNQLKVLDISAPMVFLELHQQKLNTINEALTYLGVNNQPIEKRERVTTAESESNNSFVSLNLQTRYRERLRACDGFNYLFESELERPIAVKESEVRLINGELYADIIRGITSLDGSDRTNTVS